MCAFGIALAYGPNINAPMSRVAAESALAASKRAQSRATDPAEVDLIDALAERYASTDTTACARVRIPRTCARCAASSPGHPRNLEARALYADALMNLSPWNYWHSDGSHAPGTRADSRASRHGTEGRSRPSRRVPSLHSRGRSALSGARDPLRRATGRADARRGTSRSHAGAHLHPASAAMPTPSKPIGARSHVDHETFDLPGAARRGIYPSGYMPHNHHFLSFAASMMGASQIAIDQAFEAASDVDPAVAAEHSVDRRDRAGRLLHARDVRPMGSHSRRAAAGVDQHYALGMAFYARGVAFAAKRRWAEANAALDSVGRIAFDLRKGRQQDGAARRRARVGRRDRHASWRAERRRCARSSRR